MTPSFTIAPCSITGHSLLQWREPDTKGPSGFHSIQMPSEVARHIVKACKARAALEKVKRAAEPPVLLTWGQAMNLHPASVLDLVLAYVDEGLAED